MNKSSAKGAVINKRYIRLLTGSAALLLLLSVRSVLLLGRSASLVFHINDPDIQKKNWEGSFYEEGTREIIQTKNGRISMRYPTAVLFYSPYVTSCQPFSSSRASHH